jgi:hypothetical protein
MTKLKCKKCGLFKSKTKKHVCLKSIWNKGKKGLQIGWNKGKKLSKETKQKISNSRKAGNMPDITGKNNPMFGKTPWNKGLKTGKPSWISGRKMPLEYRLKISGKNHYNWKGGKGSVNNLIRKSYEYRQWVQDILKRDNYTCQECGIYGGQLQVHHIKPFAIIILENKIKKKQDALECFELWDFENGQTLCIPCHKKTDTYLLNIKKYYDFK